MKKKILFIVGSSNQTSQMHQIATALPAYDCWFSQFFAGSRVINWGIGKGWLDHTILAGQFKENSDRYLAENHLQVDYKAQKNKYDLVVICSDLIVPKKLRSTKILWVQEGMVDEYTWLSKLVKILRLPSYLSVGTSLNGSCNIADIYCCGSEGYKQFFTEKGTDAPKLIVTGMPNFDNNKQFINNDFPHHHYVLVGTSDIREGFRADDRIGFIKKATSIAAGRPMIFKLHPNEIYERAFQEIKENAPEGTLIFQKGNINHMIANCDVLITQYSTVVYVGMSLGKEVHSYFDIDELRRLSPIQNDGKSAENIAAICREFVEFKGKKEIFLNNFDYKKFSRIKKIQALNRK